MNVYGNANQKRQAARNMLSKKGSEETLHKQTNNMNNMISRKPLEQRYRSHARGSEQPSVITKNPSKPTLELPSIHGKNDSISRNEAGPILTSNRSKKNLSLVHGQPSPVGNYNQNMPHI